MGYNAQTQKVEDLEGYTQTMIKRFKCWLYGHDWVQRGFNRIRHTTWDSGEVIESVQRDHYLFFCRCCTEIKEHACEYHYFDFSEDSPVFANCYDDEEEED